MKKLLLIILSIFIFSCNDPVFYAISTEELPLKPRIAGPSSNFVELNKTMYVAAKRTLFAYKNDNDPETDNWVKKTTVGRITHLAATTNKLYALTEKENGKEKPIILYSNDIEEEAHILIPDNDIISIYASGDILFIGTLYSYKDEDNNKIEANGVWYLHEDDDSKTPIKTTVTGGVFSMLCGVAGDNENYYLCNKDDNGIFKISKDAPYTADAPWNAGFLTNSEDKEFTNIINLNTNSIAAMSRGGILFSVTPNGVEELVKFSDNRRATSALCVFSDGTLADGVWTKGENRLLLVGRQDLTNSTTTGYTHGYVEIEFNAETGVFGESFNEPGKTAFSSISENTNEHYASSIGKRGINYFYQAPDGTLFASLNHGVWSYRKRIEGKFSWNAEE